MNRRRGSWREVQETLEFEQTLKFEVQRIACRGEKNAQLDCRAVFRALAQAPTGSPHRLHLTAT